MAFHNTARIKGYIKVEDGEMKGQIKKFQFNPEKFEYGRSAQYSESIAPGMAYPITQWVKGGARLFSVELFFWDKPHEGVIEDFWEFIESLLPPEENKSDFERPPVFLFVYGDFIKFSVMDDADIVVEEYDTRGNMTQARITLSCRQV